MLRPGWLTTVQDLGRFGFQRFGVPVGGAMDGVAFRLANRLVGNLDRAAALEITVQGPEVVFEREAVIALTGADLSPSLDGVPIPGWTAIRATGGSRLIFGERRTGARTYLAVAGGIDVPMVLGSRATHVRSRTGGYHGRALAAGDELFGGTPRPNARQLIGRSVPVPARPSYNPSPTLRAILGPQVDRFVPDAVEVLTAGRYTVTPQSDRMGYRLDGLPLAHAGSPDIVSDATPPGALQVPANRQPILLMADRQTTGGYPKIAVVISADLPLAAQLIPGDTIRFTLVDVGQAQAALRAQRAALDAAVPPI
jgi:antagonist of KipI